MPALLFLERLAAFLRKSALASALAEGLSSAAISQRLPSHGRARNIQRGFTLFELVVVILLIMLMYAVAERRVNALPAAAERASFQSVLSQVKAVVHLEAMSRFAAGRAHTLTALEGVNPMRLLLEPPANYRGEVEGLDAGLDRSSWYFDRSRGELVYLVGSASVDNVRAGDDRDVIRFRLEARRGPDLPGEEPCAASGAWQGVVLAPVEPFQWEGMMTASGQ